MASSTRLPIWIVRGILVLIIVPAALWAVVFRITTGLATILKFIWWDWCGDAAVAAHIWRTGEHPQEKNW